MGLYLVADGMGGHRAGDVASAMVRLSIADFFEVTEGVPGTWDAQFNENEDEELDPPARRLCASVRKANHDIHTASTAGRGAAGMGSTVVAAYLPSDASRAYIAHVGDSRCYRLRRGELELLTQDHSLVNEALALDPDLTEEQLSRLPSNIITRALGMDETVQVDITHRDLEPGDVFIMCSDGLSGVITNREIVETLSLIDDPTEACDVLVAMANEAGGADNITVVALVV